MSKYIRTPLGQKPREKPNRVVVGVSYLVVAVLLGLFCYASIMGSI